MTLSDFGWRCDECAYLYEEEHAPVAGRQIADAGRALADAVRRHAQPRERPAPEVWSPLEYACHVRDVLLVQRERVLEARRRETPSFSPMGRDERVEHDGYNEQDVDAVAAQLEHAAAMFENVLGRLGAGDWDRRVTYNFPARAERSLRWVAVHTLHEVAHHLRDVGGEALER